MVTKKTTTVRLPQDLGETVEVVARGRGVSVNAFIVEALNDAVDRVRRDEAFMGTLRRIAERDREILDRLAE